VALGGKALVALEGGAGGGVPSRGGGSAQSLFHAIYVVVMTTNSAIEDTNIYENNRIVCHGAKTEA